MSRPAADATLVVAGATGHVGSALVRRLIQDGRPEVHLLDARPLDCILEVTLREERLGRSRGVRHGFRVTARDGSS